MNIRESYKYLFEERITADEAIKCAKFFEYKAVKAAEENDNIEIYYKTAAAALNILSLIYNAIEFDEILDDMEKREFLYGKRERELDEFNRGGYKYR